MRGLSGPWVPGARKGVAATMVDPGERRPLNVSGWRIRSGDRSRVRVERDSLRALRMERDSLPVLFEEKDGRVDQRKDERACADPGNPHEDAFSANRG